MSSIASADARLSHLSPGEIDSLLESHAAGSYDVPVEVARISALFLDMPYKASPLGEGEGNGPDEDPLWSFNAVDCQTLIEEVLALAVSASFQEFKSRLGDIRYIDERRSFDWRNHLPESQWLPNNVKKGYIKDITGDAGGNRSLVYRRTISPGNPRSVIQGRELPQRALPSGGLVFSYIPLADTFKIAGRIPSGAIMNVIRVENPSKPYMVTHQGLVVVKESNGKEKRYLRHASRHFGGKVSDIPLETYLRTMEGYENWPALGISVFLPVMPKTQAAK